MLTKFLTENTIFILDLLQLFRTTEIANMCKKWEIRKTKILREYNKPIKTWTKQVLPIYFHFIFIITYKYCWKWSFDASKSMKRAWCLCCCVWGLVIGSLEFLKFILNPKHNWINLVLKMKKCFYKLSEKQSVDFSV